MVAMFVYLNNVSMELEFMLTLFLVLVLSLPIGSFISALTYRLPRGIGFVKGRSFCDSCKKDLYWYDNLPILSFLFYLGKSRCCSQKISFRYPLIELASLLGTFLIYAQFQSYILLALFYVTLAIFVIDIEHQIIPDELNWLVLSIYIISSSSTIYQGLVAGFLCSLVLLFLHFITYGRGMGLGDVKLAIGLGAWFDILGSLNWLIASFLTGGLIASILLFRGKAKLKTKIAFGPFLIFGFWLIKIFGIKLF